MSKYNRTSMPMSLPARLPQKENEHGKQISKEKRK
mgnify:CR=1 FL=1